MAQTTEPELIPVIYRCGCEINILSPGISDPAEVFKKIYKETGEPVKYAVLCWKHNSDSAYLKQTPPEVTEALRKAKAGED